MWVVFCIHDDNAAFLETYVDNKRAILHKPDWFISLQDTSHVSTTICPHDQEYEFLIMLNTEAVRLAGPTREQMCDCVDNLRIKLQELNILNPQENVYSKLPESRSASLLPTRDPTSPLPPPPTVPPVIVAGVESLNATNDLNYLSDVTSMR